MMNTILYGLLLYIYMDKIIGDSCVTFFYQMVGQIKESLKKHPTDATHLSLSLLFHHHHPLHFLTSITNNPSFTLNITPLIIHSLIQFMGNCLFGGPSDDHRLIKVISPTGGVMEFHSPITADLITDEFPHHAIFRTTDLFLKPIAHNELLAAGNSYYLLPLDKTPKLRHVRSNSLPVNTPAPYRMSFDSRRMFKRSYTDSNSTTTFRNNNNNSSSGGGFWKVKLVITREQLLEILSQEGRTQELIENVRTVAKCGVSEGVGSCGSSAVLSDQWSLCSSSRNGSKKDVVLEI